MAESTDVGMTISCRGRLADLTRIEDFESWSGGFIRN